MAPGAIITADSDGIHIKVSDLPTPTNLYYADYCGLSDRNDGVSIFFSQARAPSAEKLKSRLEIRLPYEAFVDNFWDSSADFLAKMRTVLAGSRFMVPHRRDSDPLSLAAEREAVMRANFVYIVRVGSDAVLDFFSLAPTDLHFSIVRTKALSIDQIHPVVRVQTSINEVMSLFNEAEPIAISLRHDLRALRKSTEDL